MLSKLFITVLAGSTLANNALIESLNTQVIREIPVQTLESRQLGGGILGGGGNGNNGSGGLVNGILCGFLGLGIFGNCHQSCPAGYSPNAKGECCLTQDFSNDINNCGRQGNVCSSCSNGTPVCNAGQCGISCFPGFNYVNGQCVSTAPVTQLGTIKNCSAVGNVCTTPFANSYPTCNPSGNGSFSCSALCYQGFYWNPQLFQCLPGAPPVTYGGVVCSPGASCSSTCVNPKFKRELTSHSKRAEHA